ncbi:MAG TPA: DUF4893 domain-containing protein [Sphingobium sp.]
MQRLLPLAATILALSACAPMTAKNRGTAIPLIDNAGWRGLVSTEDEQRVDHLGDSWRALLHGVPARYLRLVANEGELLAPDAGRDHPTPPPGSYRCRLVKLATPSSAPQAKRREAPVRSFPDFFCYVRGEKDNELSFTKQTGTELPGGWLHRDGDRRLILVGARQREAGDNSLAYGAEPDRDVVGVLERIGPFRWRLVLPWRTAEAGLDIYELTPVPQDQQAKEPRVPEQPVQHPSGTTGSGTDGVGTDKGSAARNP